MGVGVNNLLAAAGMSRELFRLSLSGLVPTQSSMRKEIIESWR